MALNLDLIHDDICKGLQRDRKRLAESKKNLDYYRGDYDCHRYKIKDDYDGRCNRGSMILKLIVDKQCSYLYRDVPVRIIPGQENASSFLNEVYGKNGMYAKWPAADRLTMLGSGGAVAWQVAATETDIKIHLWYDGQFVVYEDPDDPLRIVAVATLDSIGEFSRCRLYTDELVRTYLRKADDGLGEFELTEEEANTYGVLPFSFAHYETPVLDFWAGSPGNVLREAQDYTIFRLTSLADAVKYLAYPKVLISGHDPTWTPPKDWSPDEYLSIPASPDNGTGIAGKVTVQQIQASLNFVEAVWTDITKYNEHILECAGVPIASVRMVQSTARSGNSIAQEQAPLVNFARGRQRAWLEYETNLAKLVLQVAVAHLDRDDLRPALDDFSLSVRWSSNYNSIPGPERDRADAFDIANGFRSTIQVIQEREGCSEEEAIAKLAELKRHREIEAQFAASIEINTPNNTSEMNTDE